MKRYIKASNELDEIDMLKRYGYTGIFYCTYLYFMKETILSNNIYQNFYVYKGDSEDIKDILRDKKEIPSSEYYRSREDFYAWHGIKSHSHQVEKTYPELFNGL